MNVPNPFISACNCDTHLNIDMYSLQVEVNENKEKEYNLMIIHGWKCLERNREE